MAALMAKAIQSRIPEVALTILSPEYFFSSPVLAAFECARAIGPAPARLG
jgi:hypothetical protein